MMHTDPAAAAGAALIAQRWAPLVMTLLGVVTARVAYTTRAQRLGDRSTRRETISISVAAMLVVGPPVWEYRVGLTIAALLGLGVGWGTMATLDALAAGSTGFFAAILSRMTGAAQPARRMTDDQMIEMGRRSAQLDPTPSDMIETLGDLDARNAKRIEHKPKDDG